MKTGRRSSTRGRRSLARLAGVQALYEMELSGAGCDPVLREFHNDRWAEADADAALPAPDGEFLGHLVRGITADLAAIDALITGVLAADLALDRLEVLLRAILRAGTWELKAAPEVPARVVINEYVDVAHAFFEGKETALVNAVLDRLARQLRAGEAGSDGGARSGDAL